MSESKKEVLEIGNEDGKKDDVVPVEFYLSRDGNQMDLYARRGSDGDTALVLWFIPDPAGTTMEMSTDEEDLATLGFAVDGHGRVKITD